MILKAVPGNPGKFNRLFQAPLNNLGTQCTSLIYSEYVRFWPASECVRVCVCVCVRVGVCIIWV